MGWNKGTDKCETPYVEPETCEGKKPADCKEHEDECVSKDDGSCETWSGECQTSPLSQNACQRAASGSTDHQEPSHPASKNAQKDGLVTSAKTRLRRSAQTSSHLMPSTTSPSPL